MWLNPKIAPQPISVLRYPGSKLKMTGILAPYLDWLVCNAASCD
jgi:hypothetical protein